MDEPAPRDVTLLLRRWKVDGDPAAEEELFRVFAPELAKIARETLSKFRRLDHKINAAELVSEAYLRIERDYPIVTENRGPFKAIIRKVMRQHLLDLIKRDRAAKRPSLLRLDTQAAAGIAGPSIMDLQEYDAALEALERLNPRQAQIIDMKVFGLTSAEIAAALKVGRATVTRDLAAGRAFIAFQLGLPANWLSD
jgi:RNA polymerase sigma factor (TIGR02999 family)